MCGLKRSGGQAPADCSAHFVEFLKVFTAYAQALDGRIEEAKIEESREGNYIALFSIEFSIIKFAASRRFCVTREGRIR